MKNVLIKKSIIIAVLIIILSNFITANCVYGDDVSDTKDKASQDVESYLGKEVMDGSSITGDVGDGGAGAALDMTDKEFEDKINNAINLANQQETGAEGILFTPITQFILAIADSVMATMQGAFIGSGKTIGNLVHASEIEMKTPSVKGVKIPGVTRYALRYTPAAIFSGDIPAFDTNFFEPMGDDDGIVKFNNIKREFIHIKNVSYNDCINDYNLQGQLQSSKDKFTTAETLATVLSIVCTINAVEALAAVDNDIDWASYGLGGGGSVLGIGGEVDVDMSVPIFEADIQGILSVGMFTAGAAAAGTTYATLEALDTNMYYAEWQVEQPDGSVKTYFFITESPIDLDIVGRNSLPGALYEVRESTSTVVNEKYSAAFQLKPVVSKWYTNLRTIALVGLLSVLVYVGIRILISVTSQEKAKYKKMLVDWVVAICILFVLHYIMIFIVKITESLVDILNVNISLSDGSDIFATKIRNMATGDAASSYMQYFGYVVIYIALTILTVIFTIQYTKRLVLLAFLTMIAPLIALTYPIDKISDGKAQAFSYWIKEYIFNSLLQPMHLLLYTIFISSATEIMDVNPVYAVVVLSFFVSAEQIFRRIFGFDKASTVNGLGAAAGGAMVMNMINKMRGSTKGKGNNGSNEKANQNKIRMARENNSEDSRDNANSNGTGLINKNNSENDSESDSENSRPADLLNSNNSRSNIGNSRPALLDNNNLESNIGNNTATGTKAKGNKPKSNVGQGLKSVGKGLAIRGAKRIGSAGKKVLKKAPGAIAGATIGIAATVASGGENAATFIGGGTMAGAAITGNVADKVTDTAKKGTQRIREDYKKGVQKNLTKEQEKMLAGYEKMLKDTKIQNICKKDGLEVKDSIRLFIDRGITDPEKIRSSIENGTTNPDNLDKR